MKLLFDENLSDRLVRLLADVFPGSSHVKAAGLMRRSDTDVWNCAKHNDFVIVSKDADFHERSIIEGPPPKVIFLRFGNVATLRVRDLLVANREVIEEFGRSVGGSALVLGNVDLV